jgi:hypothetical protein
MTVEREGLGFSVFGVTADCTGYAAIRDASGQKGARTREESEGSRVKGAKRGGQENHVLFHRFVMTQVTGCTSASQGGRYSAEQRIQLTINKNSLFASLYSTGPRDNVPTRRTLGSQISLQPTSQDQLTIHRLL